MSIRELRESTVKGSVILACASLEISRSQLAECHEASFPNNMALAIRIIELGDWPAP
jgi:hypothetical protein